METRKFLLGSVFIGGTLAVIRLLFVKSDNKSTFHDAIDTLPQEQMHRLVGAPG